MARALVGCISMTLEKSSSARLCLGVPIELKRPTAHMFLPSNGIRETTQIRTQKKGIKKKGMGLQLGTTTCNQERGDFGKFLGYGEVPLLEITSPGDTTHGNSRARQVVTT